MQAPVVAKVAESPLSVGAVGIIREVFTYRCTSGKDIPNSKQSSTDAQSVSNRARAYKASRSADHEKLD